MIGGVIQGVAFYVLLGAFIGMTTYFWERRHWKHQYRSDLLLYILIGACVGTPSLAVLIAAAPGILLLRAQDIWSRRIAASVPGKFPWLDGIEDRVIRASRAKTR